MTREPRSAALAPALAGALAGQQGLPAALWLALAGGVLLLAVALRLHKTATVPAPSPLRDIAEGLRPSSPQNG